MAPECHFIGTGRRGERRLGYFGHGEWHRHLQPLCELKAQAGTHRTMYFRLQRASRIERKSLAWLVFTAGDFGV